MARANAVSEAQSDEGSEEEINDCEARNWRHAAEEALKYAENKLADATHPRDQLPPAIRGDLFRATLLVNKYGEKGYESQYSRRYQQRFLDQLHQFNERIIKIKNRCTIRTGRCIDCNQGYHPAGECPEPDQEDSDVDPWATTDEGTDSDLPDLEDDGEGGEETVEDWFWRNHRIWS